MVEFTPDDRYARDFAEMMSDGTLVEYVCGKFLDREFCRRALGACAFVGENPTVAHACGPSGSLYCTVRPTGGRPWCLHAGVTYTAYDANPQDASHLFRAFAPPGITVPDPVPEEVRAWARRQVV